MAVEGIVKARVVKCRACGINFTFDPRFIPLFREKKIVPICSFCNTTLYFCDSRESPNATFER